MTIAAGNVQYTYAQLEGIWQQAGGNPQYAPMAAAIAMAESGGNSAAYGVNTNGTIDRGLWQINSVHGSQSSFDVMTNARAAVAISSNGVNWRPWCTAYSDGACGTRGGAYLGDSSPYRRYITGSTPPDLSAPINGTNAAANLTTSTQAQLTGCSWFEYFIHPGGCVAKDAEGAAAQVVDGLIATVLNPLIQVVAGVMGITGGAILMIGGIFMMVRETQAYQDTKGAVRTGAAAAAAPETGGASLAAAGGKQQAPVGGNLAMHQNAQQRAERRELKRRQDVAANKEARQLSTQELLRREAGRYGKVPS